MFLKKIIQKTLKEKMANMNKHKLKRFPEYNQKVVNKLIPELSTYLNKGISGYGLFEKACLYAFINNLQGKEIEELKKDLRYYIKFFDLLQKEEK